jgi:hypothetical protein
MKFSIPSITAYASVLLLGSAVTQAGADGGLIGAGSTPQPLNLFNTSPVPQPTGSGSRPNDPGSHQDDNEDANDPDTVEPPGEPEDEPWPDDMPGPGDSE